MENKYEKRVKAIEFYLEGKTINEICNEIGCSNSWFYKWKKEYEEYGWEGLKGKSKAPHKIANKTDKKIENEIVKIRKYLCDENITETKYAFIGADSIQWELEREGKIPKEKIPSISTINRIIKRNNLTKKIKHPKKKSLFYPGPEITAPNSVHQLDTIGPRYISAKNGTEKFYAINLVDCYSRMDCIKTSANIRNTTLLDFLTTHVWTVIGIPKVLQVDNVLSVKGSNKYPRSQGIVIKWCLHLGIEILFIPVREPQRNGVVEKSNFKFETKFFRTQKFNSMEKLNTELALYMHAINVRFANSILNKKIHGARTPHQVHFQNGVTLLENTEEVKAAVKKQPIAEGKISFVRFIRKDCMLNIFTEKFLLPNIFRYSYVKATIYTKYEIMVVAGKNNTCEFSYKLTKK